MRKIKRWAALALSMLLLTETASVQAVSFVQGTNIEVEQSAEEQIADTIEKNFIEVEKHSEVPEENSVEVGQSVKTTEENMEYDYQEEENGGDNSGYEEYYNVIFEDSDCSMVAGETVQLVVYTSAPANEITYSSSDETIATVSSTGLVTAVSGGETGHGSAIITVTWKSPSGQYTSYDTCYIDVKNTLFLDKEYDTIYTKQKTKYKLKATCKPAGKVTWKTSDKKIATVNASGVVTPKKAGQVTITATAGGVSASCYITVKEPYFSLNETAMAYLKHKVQLPYGIEPASKITWKSSNPKIATVDSKGVVTGKKKGTVTITAKANGITKKCKVTVAEPSIYIWKNDFAIFKGSTYDIYASVQPYTAKVKWTSSNKKVVKVDQNGTITALKTGKAKITAAINGAKVTCQVKVVKDTCKLNSTKRTMITGEKIQIYVQKPSDVWSSYSLKEWGVVSTSTENGACTVTANAPGTAQVMVSFSVYDNGKDTYYRKPCTIKVVDSGISKQQFAVAKGKTKALEMVNIGEEIDIASIQWSSTAPNIATVNAETGVVTGVKTGTATIKSVVTYVSGSQKTYTATVKVSDPKISVSNAVVALQGNKKIALKGINEYSDIQWESNKESVLTVGADGIIRPYSKGTATVKATVDGKSLSCKVYVSNPQLKSSYSRCVLGTKLTIPLKGLHAKSKVTYKSSNTKVAKVDSKGKVNVVGGGRAQILVNADGKEMYYTVEVASQRAIDACEKGYAIITTSVYSQANRMAEGFYDCSSLVFRAYGKDAGMLGGSSSWAPTAAGMAQHMLATGKVLAMKAISLDQLRPGDLIFYGQQNNGRYLGIYHVSMYYGDGLRLESPLDGYWERDNIVMVARPAP